MMKNGKFLVKKAKEKNMYLIINKYIKRKSTKRL